MGGAVELHGRQEGTIGNAAEYNRSGHAWGTDASMVARKSYSTPSGSKVMHGPIPVYRQTGVGVPVRTDYRTAQERRQGLKM